MGIGRVLGAVAPIAAGYFAPGAGALFGNATANAIAAGAATGAGIAALSGDDPLTGAVTGGLGGMSGGSLKTAFTPGVAPKTTTAASNLENLTAANQAAANQATNVGMASNPAALGGSRAGTTFGGLDSFGPNMNQVNLGAQGPGVGMTAQQGTSGLDVGGGYVYTPSEVASLPSGSTEVDFMTGIENLGGGSKARGAGRLGITGAGIAASAGAFEPDLASYEDSVADRYDPNRRLDLAMDTDIDRALGRDTGLRLLSKGGDVKKYVLGGRVADEYTPAQLSSLAEYGVVPQYQKPQSMGMNFGGGNINYNTAAYRQPVTGVVDVGGKFVADPKGDITDVEYTKRFDYILNPKEDKAGEASSGDISTIDASAKSGIGAIPALAVAQGYAEQQESPTKAQTLGLEALQAGGYLETGGQVGDGMSDEIPATIEGTQEARLSDGEFVIPADVVSHLGNGSSDAGAKRLYEMMDKVRVARTGTKQQGKEIKPKEYMPS
jgi:hypothetical protein